MKISSIELNQANHTKTVYVDIGDELSSPKFGLRTPKILKKSEKGNRLNTYTLMDPVINNFIDKWNCFYEEVERYKLSIILMCD